MLFVQTWLTLSSQAHQIFLEKKIDRIGILIVRLYQAVLGPCQDDLAWLPPRSPARNFIKKVRGVHGKTIKFCRWQKTMLPPFRYRLQPNRTGNPSIRRPGSHSCNFLSFFSWIPFKVWFASWKAAEATDAGIEAIEKMSNSQVEESSVVIVKTMWNL